MKKENLFEKISELKTRFGHFFQHRKKITALENYSTAEKFPHKNYLTLVKSCMTEGFLGDQESQFLDYMLTKYEVNYLDWAHKTKWLKREIDSRRVFKPSAMQMFFDLGRKETPINVPVEILAGKSSQIGKRI